MPVLTKEEACIAVADLAPGSLAAYRVASDGPLPWVVKVANHLHAQGCPRSIGPADSIKVVALRDALHYVSVDRSKLIDALGECISELDCDTLQDNCQCPQCKFGARMNKVLEDVVGHA